MSDLSDRVAQLEATVARLTGHNYYPAASRRNDQALKRSIDASGRYWVSATVGLFDDSGAAATAQAAAEAFATAADAVVLEDAEDYTDAAMAYLKWKDSVVCSSTVAVTLATDVESGDSLDSVTLSAGDRILIRHQSDARENGIYIVAASGSPARATDADTILKLHSCVVTVEKGATYQDRVFMCINNNTGSIGASNITFQDLRTSIAAAAATHATQHQNGGSDEISVAGLSGQLADDQPPLPHGSDHQPGQSDAVFAADTGWSSGTHSAKRSLATGDSLADTQDYLLTLVEQMLALKWPTA